MESRRQTSRDLESQLSKNHQLEKGFEQKKASYVRDCTYKVIPGCLLVLMLFSIGAVMTCALKYNQPVPREGVLVVSIMFWVFFILFLMGLLKMYHDKHYTHIPRMDVFNRPMYWAKKLKNMPGKKDTARPDSGFVSNVGKVFGSRSPTPAQPAAPPEAPPISRPPTAHSHHQPVTQRGSHVPSLSQATIREPTRSNSASHTPPDMYPHQEQQMELGAGAAENPREEKQRRLRSDDLTSLRSQTQLYARRTARTSATPEVDGGYEDSNDPELCFARLPDIRLPDDFYDLAYKVEGISEIVDELVQKQNTSEDTDEDESIMRGFGHRPNIPIQKVNVHKPDTRVNKFNSFKAVQCEPTPPASRQASTCAGGPGGVEDACARANHILAMKSKPRLRSITTRSLEPIPASRGFQECQNCMRSSELKRDPASEPATPRCGVRLVTPADSSDVDNDSTKASDVAKMSCSMASNSDESISSTQISGNGPEDVDSVPELPSDLTSGVKT